VPFSSTSTTYKTLNFNGKFVWYNFLIIIFYFFFVEKIRLLDDELLKIHKNSDSSYCCDDIRAVCRLKIDEVVEQYNLTINELKLKIQTLEKNKLFEPPEVIFNVKWSQHSLFNFCNLNKSIRN
jgi:hypothetical protein